MCGCRLICLMIVSVRCCVCLVMVVWLVRLLCSWGCCMVLCVIIFLSVLVSWVWLIVLRFIGWYVRKVGCR